MQREQQIAVRRHRLRKDAQGRLKVSDGFGDLARVTQHHRQVAQEERVFWTQKHRLLETMSGLTRLAAIAAQQAQAHPGGGRTRIEFEAGAEGGIGFLNVPTCGKNLSQNPQRMGVGRLVTDHGLDLKERGLNLTGCQKSIGLDHAPINL